MSQDYIETANDWNELSREDQDMILETVEDAEKLDYFLFPHDHMVYTFVVTVTIQDPEDAEFSLDNVSIIDSNRRNPDIETLARACLISNGRNPETVITQEITITTNPPKSTI